MSEDVAFRYMNLDPNNIINNDYNNNNEEPTT